MARDEGWESRGARRGRRGAGWGDERQSLQNGGFSGTENETEVKKMVPNSTLNVGNSNNSVISPALPLGL